MMSEKEFNKKLFPENFWFSPSWVIDTFSHYLNQYKQICKNERQALAEILKKRNAKKLKEMWASAVFLLGYQKITNNEHWLKPCNDTAPDVFGVCFIPNIVFEDSHSQAQIFIEVTEWTQDSKQELAKRIKDKLLQKFYPDYYHLVVHITRVGDLNINLDFVYDELIKINLKISGVWVVVSSVKDKIEDNYLVACLYPIKAKYEFSLNKEVEEDRKNKIQILMINKGKGRKVEGIEAIKLEIPNMD